MDTRKGLLILLFAVFILVLSFWSVGFAQDPSDSQPEGATSASARDVTSLGSDSNPAGPPEIIIPEQYQPSTDDISSMTAADEVRNVYFTPQDEDTSTTVMFLYNTGSETADVNLQTYTLNGTLNINTVISVPAAGLVRICGDTVSSVSASWQNVILVNFTTFSTYAKMALPSGVKAEAYVVWNNANTYDPLQVAPTLPIRFSSDPLMVFLPTIQR